MSTADLGTFACDACGKNYKWKPEFTGRKIKCKCGHVMAPIEPLRPRPRPVPPPADAHDNGGLPDLDSLYDLSPDAATLARAEAGAQSAGDDGGYDIAGSGDGGAAVQCPSCGSHLQPGQALCLDCGYNLKTGSKLKTQLLRETPYVPSKKLIRDDDEGSAPTDLEARLGLSLKKDVYLPVGLILAGLILAYVNAMWGLELGFGAATVWVGFWTFLGTVLTFVGVLITAKLMSLGLGHPLQVLLKVAAVALLPTAISDIIQSSTEDAAIGFAGWGVALVITYILFMILFGMDFGESIFCATVIWVLTNWLLGLILALVIAGVGISIASGGGGFFSGDDEDEEDPAFVEPDAPAKKSKKPVTKPADTEAQEDAPDPENKDPDDPNPAGNEDDACSAPAPMLGLLAMASRFTCDLTCDTGLPPQS